MDFNYDSGIIDTLYVLDTTQTPPTTNVSGVQNILQVLGGAVSLPTSGTAVSSPLVGYFRYNTGGWLEYYYNSTWNQLTTGSGVSISNITTSGTYYPMFTASTSGTLSVADVTSGALTFNPNTGLFTSTLLSASTITSTVTTGTAPFTVTSTTPVANLSIGGNAATATTATNATNTAITNNTSSGSTWYPTFVSANTGNLPQTVDSSSFTFVPSTGTLAATVFSGSGASLTNIPNGALTNSSVTIGTTTISLGGTSTTLGGMTGITLTSGTVTGVANPVNPTDVVNYQTLQAFENGLEWKTEAAAGTTANLTATYSNGSSGVGATLTNSGTQVAFATDGYSASLNDRILVKNQTTQTQNGIYYVSTVGSGSTNWVLTRTLDANTPTELNNATLYLTNGTAGGGTSWTQTTANPTIGTNNIVFVQASGPGAAVTSFSAGTTGLTPSTATTGAVTLAGTLVVSNGGTGAGTFTSNGVIYGNTTSALGVTAAGATGQVLIGTTSNPPSWSTLSGIAVTSITGTANQITASAATGAVTLSTPSTFVAPGSVQVTTSMQVSATNSISATSGTTQGSTPLTTDYNVITTVTAGDAVTLPAGLAGRVVTVVNRGANAVLVFPASGAAIDGLAANASISLPAGQEWAGEAISATQWYSVDTIYASGTGISVSVSGGTVTYTNTGVTTFQTSLSGLTPSTATTGAITLAGTLGATSGGTGVSNSYTITLGGAISTAGSFTTSGANPLTLTTTGSTSVTLPTSGTLLTSSGAVTTFSAGTTGLTPSTGTSGAITLAGTLVVSNGGTGAGTFTSNGVIYGNTTSALGVTAAGATGQVLIGTTSNPPSWSGSPTLTGLTLSGLTANSFLYSGTSGALTTTTAPTNGQMLIGSTGAAPVLGTITATSGNSYVTTGAGTLAISGPKYWNESTTAPSTNPSDTANQGIAIGNSAVNAQTYGGMVFANGAFSTAGDAQHGVYVLRNTTSNATPTELFMDGSTNRYVTSTNKVTSFSILISGMDTTASPSHSGGFKIEGVLYCGATASTTAFIGTPALTVLGRVPSTLTASVTANTSGYLQIFVTGEASVTYHWAATLMTTEVTTS